MPSNYAGDPYWTTARRPGACYCGNIACNVERGDRIFWYPRYKAAYADACGDRAEADFLRCRDAEDAYNNVA